MALQQLFDRNKQYEDAAVLDLDAVLHKATQETCEYLEAVQQFDFSHAQDEIADALTNILAVQYRLSPEFNGLTPTPPTKDVLPLDIVVHLGKWNDAVQKYR